MATKRTERVKLAHELFKQKGGAQDTLTLSDIASYTGWSEASVRTYMSKKWAEFISEVDKGIYRVSPDFEKYTLAAFELLHTQKFIRNNDPLKPILSQRTEELLTKSRESALLAVQVYNNPLMLFKTPAFVVHMIIAFTSLFHAVFEREGVAYHYTNNDGSIATLHGQPKLWDISACIKHFWDNANTPSRKNLEMFVELRHVVEHRFAPTFDSTVAGECQALLLNYEHILVEEFSPYYALDAQIAIPLQITKSSSRAKADALKELQSEDYRTLKDYIDTCRAALDDDIFNHPDYAFRVFIVQTPANRERSSDMTMQFIPYDDASKEEIDKFKDAVTFIKTKSVPVANQGKYKPGQVVRMVQEIMPKFTMHQHTQAWKFFGVRQMGKSAERCDVTYCQYDEAHDDYVYTEQWVERLKQEVADPIVFNQIRQVK